MSTTMNDDGDVSRKIFGFLLLGILLVIGLVFLLGSWYTIQSGEEGILLTWGRASPGSVGPGFHGKWPIAQEVVKFDVRTQNYGADASSNTYDSASSKDLQVVKVNVVVNYHLVPDKVPEIFTAVGASYQDTVIVPTLHDTLKAVTAQYTAEELITKREEVRGKMQELLSDKLRPYNIVVEQVSIVKFDFSDQFNQAIEAKVTAEQQKQKAENDLQRIKVEAEQQVATAQGARDAAIASAEGAARTTQLTAEADAEKVRLINEQLQKTPQYIEYVKAQKWDGHLPVSFSGSGVQPFLNVAPLAFANGTG